MKVGNKSIAVMGIAVSLFAGSAFADDFNTVVSIDESPDNNTVRQNVVNPKVTILDYVKATIQPTASKKDSNSVAGLSSRWHTDRLL